MSEPKKPGRPKLDNVRMQFKLPPDVVETIREQPIQSAFLSKLVRAWAKRNKKNG